LKPSRTAMQRPRFVLWPPRSSINSIELLME
jgi:hypothetical protein